MDPFNDLFAMERRSLINNGYLSHLSAGLSEFIQTGQHSDITIRVENRSFHCHKVILGSMSPYFKAMFSHEMKEVRDGVAVLQDITAETFETILNFMYCGKDVVNSNNAVVLLQAASLMQITCLVDICEYLLVFLVVPDNCIELWKLAKAHNCRKLEERSWTILLQNFQHVASSEDFLEHLTCKELISIIKDDALQTPNEEVVCDAILHWVQFDADQRNEHLGELFEVLRMPLVTSEYLFILTATNDLIKDSPKCTAVIHEAQKYHMCPSRRQDFTSGRTFQRQNSAMHDMIVVIGGLASDDTSYETTTAVMSYSLQEKKWFYLASLPFNPGYEFAKCTYGDNIFLSGGCNKKRGLMEYNVHLNSWTILSSMIVGRFRHAMCAVSNSIFVLGGCANDRDLLTSVEEYSVLTQKWERVGDLIVAVESMSAAVIGEKIFVFGGATQNDEDTAVIQCFDTRQRTVSVVGELPSPCRLTRAVVYDKTVLVVTINGKILEITEEESSTGGSNLSLDRNPAVFNTKLSQTVKSKVQHFYREQFEAVQSQGLIYLAGGQAKDGSVTRTIAIIEPISGNIFAPITMPCPRWCFGCVKTVVRKEYLNSPVKMMPC